MDFDQIQQTLNDLPSTFKRLGAPYRQLVDALTTALNLYTGASDDLVAQLRFDNARYGWVDVWGSLATILRRQNESDFVYKPRIQNMILAPRLSPVAITLWLAIVELVTGTVTESLPSVGYSITLPSTLTSQQIQNILQTLAYVRPAGVPFQFLKFVGGTYLGTVNYLGGAPRVTGAYLPGSAISAGVVLSSSTNNAEALLPDLLFTDPLLNPSLASAVSGAA